ncbi:MAG: SBBP repeat-containing protein, partial [Bacteroidales bacterium]|nr:SBBP repeat-containing protein [Bacteroidales bacterium]
DDFIIGAYYNDDGGNNAGQTYLILGKAAADWGMGYDLSLADASFIGEDSSDESGFAVSGIGDVDGDSYDDFIIGAYKDEDGGSQAGQTYLILGRPAADWGMDYNLSLADASFWGENTGDYSGSGVSGAGDVNGDGLNDFIIGAYYNDDGGSNAGQTYLLLSSVEIMVTVVVPNGGEVWLVGETYQIQWTAWADLGVCSDSVFYSVDNGSTRIFIETHTGNPQVCEWEIPDNTSEQCLIKVVVYDGENNSAEDISDAVFTIKDENQPGTQNWLWALSGGSPDTGYDYGNSVSVDNNENVYVAGYFAGTATFGNTTFTSSGGHDIFIAKYDTYGNGIWAKKAGGSYDDEAYGTALDENGNIYVTGCFEGVASFGTFTLVSAGGSDIFITKYDSNGNEVWAVRAGGYDDLNSRCIEADSNGNILITGFFRGTVSFESTTLYCAGNRDFFIAKYSSAGNLLWVKQGGGSNYDRGYNLTTDNDNNVYATGYFGGTATFGTTVLTCTGKRDVFIVKYDETGNLIWIWQAGGPEYSYGRGITVDINYNSYITGSFEDTAYFGNDTLIADGTYDVFTAKYDINGNYLWVRQAGGNDSDRAYSATVDDENNVYITGYYRSVAMFDDTTSLTSMGSTDNFVVKYNSEGDVIWAKSAGGPYVDTPYDIAFKNKNIFITGYFFYEAFFDNITINTVGLSQDMFLGKLKFNDLASISVNLKVFLEGPFNGTDMNTHLNPADLPLTQPYNIAPWNYTGTESVTAIPNVDIVDWVLVELRDTTEAQYATGSTKIEQQAAFLLNDGSVVGLDGIDPISCISTTITSNLFVVIWHRNHLGVLSAYPLTETAGIYNYDFTTGAGRVFGGASGHKEIGTGIWGM